MRKPSKTQETPEGSVAGGKKAIPQTEVSPVQLRSERPLIFISHDSRDADLAEVFANLLGDASGGMLEPFSSSDHKGTAGIEYGQDWYRVIMRALAAQDRGAPSASKTTMLRPHWRQRRLRLSTRLPDAGALATQEPAGRRP